MTGNVVARRYAKALFAVGEAKGADELAAYGKELSALAESLEDSPDALKFFKSPLFSADEKRAVLGSLGEKLTMGQVIKNFCNLLADKERLAAIPDISASFTTLLDAQQGILRGELVSAVELSDDKQKAIQAELEKKSGKKLVLGFEKDESILGGVMLKIGDKVLDASIKAQLQILKETIKRGE